MSREVSPRISYSVLLQLLIGGVPGVLLGGAFSRKVPVRRMKAVIATIAMLAASQLVWSGSKNLAASWSAAERADKPAALR